MSEFNMVNYDAEVFLDRLYFARRNRLREYLTLAEVYHRGNMPELRDFCESEFWACVAWMLSTAKG